MAGSSFRDLNVYRLSAALADDLHQAVMGWDSFSRWSTGIQLVRAADSIGANIAEGTGRWHPADSRRLLFIARGSLYETEHWMLRAESRGLLKKNSSERLNEIERAQVRQARRNLRAVS